MKRFYTVIAILLFVVAAIAQGQTINLHGFAAGSSMAGNSNATFSVIGEPFTGIATNNGYEITKGLAQAQLEVMEVEAVVNYGEGYNENGFSYPATTPVGIYTASLYSPLGGSYHYDLLKKLTLTVESGTPCNPISLPYTENFDGFTSSTTAATGVEPTCWELVQSDVQMTEANRPQLYYRSDYAHSGKYSLLLNYRGVYAMPELSEDVSVKQVKLEMYLRQPKSYYALQVGVWEDNGTFVPVATFNNSGTGLEFVECDFSDYNGNGRRIAFRNISGDNTVRNYSYNYIDDINLTNNCEPITLPYTEDFDSYTASTTAATGVEPNCWNLVQPDVQMTDANRPQLYYKSSYAHSGNYSLLLNYRGVYAMPELSSETQIPINRVKLEMYVRQPKAYYQLEVGVWNGQMFVPVQRINNSTTEVEKVTVDFSGFEGWGNTIAFRNVLADGYSYNYSYNYIDDITLTEIPEQVCGIIELPYTENFDDYTQSTTAETGVQPRCWEVVNEDVALTNSTKPQVYYNAAYATSGSYTLRMKNRCVYALPELNVNDPVSSLTMTFKLRQPKTVYRLQVGVVDAQDNFTLVKTINNSSTETEDITVDFANYTGNGRRIAFRNTVSSSSTLEYSVNYIDDITLDVTPAACGIIELPYSENFDDYTASTTAETGVQPRCWEVTHEDVALTNSTKPQVYYNTTYATSGSYTLRMKNRCVYAMPELNVNDPVSSLTMTFKLRQPKTVYRLQVGVVDAQDNFTLVKTINNSSTETEEITVDFANYTGNGRRIAFRNTVSSSSTLEYSVNYIDDIMLDIMPAACGIFELPYSENFDDYTASTTAETGVQPRCWEVTHEDVALTNSTKPQVYYNTTYATSGSYTLRMKNRCVYALPELNVNQSLSELTMTFKLRQPKTVYRLQVGVVDAQGNFTSVKTINNSSTETEDITVDFANYTGNGRRIAFRNTVSSSSTLDYSVNYIDDITLDITPAACGIFELPYTDNFDDYTQSTTAETGVQPRCWEVTHEDVALTNSTKPQVYYNTTYATSGSYTLRMKNRCVYALPELNVNQSVNELTMTFRLRQPKTVYRLQVGVVDAQGNFTSVKTINNSSTETEDITVDFANYTGNGRRIAFRNTVSSSSTLEYSVNYIDNITLDVTPAACGIFELPYTENFDDYTQSTTAETGVQPNCWEVITEEVALTNATKPQVYYNATYATSGSYTLRMKNRCVYAMPELNVNDPVSSLTMTFKLRQPKAVYRLQVGVVDAQGNFTSVKTINNSSTETEDITVDFANYTGNGRRIAFRNTVSSSSTLDYSVNYIDNINLFYNNASGPAAFVFTNIAGEVTNEFSTSTGEGMQYIWKVNDEILKTDTLVWVEYEFYRNGVALTNRSPYDNNTPLTASHIENYISTVTAGVGGASSFIWNTKNEMDFQVLNPSGTIGNMHDVSYYFGASAYAAEDFPSVNNYYGNHFPYSNLSFLTTTNYYDDLWMHFLAQRPITQTIAPFLSGGEYTVIFKLYATTYRDNWQNPHVDQAAGWSIAENTISPRGIDVNGGILIGGHWYSKGTPTLLAVDSIHISVDGPDMKKSEEIVNNVINTDRDQLDVVVYPNPTKDVVNVQCTMNNAQCSGIEIVDVYGKIITTVGTRFIASADSPASAQSPVQINVSGLAAGMYFVRVTTDRGVVTKPFVKR